MLLFVQKESCFEQNKKKVAGKATFVILPRRCVINADFLVLKQMYGVFLTKSRNCFVYWTNKNKKRSFLIRKLRFFVFG